MPQPTVDKTHFRAKAAKLRDHPDVNVNSFADQAEMLLQELIDVETQMKAATELKKEPTHEPV